MTRLRVGLTGGIASGKTLVADMLAQFGAALVDTDLLARDVVAPGEPALQRIAELFGAQMLTPEGYLDRRQLRSRVFGDDQARAQLDALLHPLIRARTLEQMQQLSRTAAPYIVAVVPLLVENGFDEHVDRVLVVDCPREMQLQRLMQRDGMDQATATAMLDAQASRAQRLAVANDVIDNSGAVAWTRAQTWRCHCRYEKHR